MRHLASKVLILPPACLALLAACSGTTTGGGSSTTSITGTATLTFSTSFVGSASTSGTCPVCGPLPGSGGSGTPSGPASYHGVVVLLSDDPSLQGHCADASAEYSFDNAKYHYLTIQVTSTEAIASGSYVIHPGFNQTTGGSYGYVDESKPTNEPTGVGFDNEDNGTGTVDITALGTSVQGSFDAMGLELFGAGASQGDLSGTFDAPSCPALAAIAFQGPCGGCPG
jgi:hypothetical protein